MVGSILGNCRGRDHRDNGSRDRSSAVTIDLSLGAVARDVAGFAASVASLASSVERAAVRRGAVTRDVT